MTENKTEQDAKQLHEIAPEDRVPTKQKIVYGIGSTNELWGNWMFPSMIWPVFNIFLHVSPVLVGMVIMINRLIDAVSDPFFGSLSDNTRTKWGRRRPFILIGAILTACAFPLLFMCGTGWKESTYFWWMIITSGILITFASVHNMAYAALGNEMTPDYHERTSIFSYKAIIQKLPELMMFFAAAFITLSIFNDPKTGKPDILQGARVYAVIIGVIMIIVAVIVVTVIKERYYESVSSKQEKVKISDSLFAVLTCKPFRVQLAIAIAIGIGMSMVGNLGYYTTVYYVCGGDVALGSKWNFIMGLTNLAFPFVGVPFFVLIAKRTSKKIALTTLLFLFIGVFMATWVLYNPAIKWLQLFASGLIAFMQAGFWMLYGSMMGDVVDWDELETGSRREGAFNACANWMMKVGMALGGGASGILLKLTGFDETLGGDQSVQSLTLIRLCLAGFPIIGYIVALLFLWRLKLTPAVMKDVRRQLEERRGTV